MSAKHLRLKPQHIDDHAWWYEEVNGISVVIEVDAPWPQTGRSTKMVFISWARLRSALTRRDKKP
jgi:hypothetical protein